jgi:hypothetical protein
VKVNNIFDAVGAILTLALVAVFFTKANTATDVNAVGTQFTGAIRTAEAGT